MTLPPELDLALAATRHAGRLVMRHFGRLERVEYKAPGQPVTAADLEADRSLRAALLAGAPGTAWLSEETADGPERLRHERVWVVDPIDGTNSFVHGIPEFVISVALVEDGEPLLGVVHNPASGEMYHAVRGRGAWRDGEPIRVAPPPGEGESWKLLSSRSELKQGELAAFRPPTWEIVPMGSTAYRMAKVADGTGHVFFTRSIKGEWDVCAASLLLREAGGVAARSDGRPYLFNRPTPRLAGVLAACCTTLPLPLRGAVDGNPNPQELG
jgi:myo-inositol-1(or 4)-monophosphatase